MTSARTILFIDKVFLRKRQDIPLRGVELFNLGLLRDLAELGLRVTVAADYSWQGELARALAGREHDLKLLRLPVPDFLKGWFGALRLAGRRFDTLLVGNAGNGILPMVRCLATLGAMHQTVLIAHREASPRFVRTFSRLPGHVVAVNGKIAAPFRAAGHPSVQVDYGIRHAGLFFPPPIRREDPDDVRFCVIGMLDNAWKGSDTAVNAFRRLPEEVRRHTSLHLCSFTDPPSFPEPNIKAYPWLEAGALPDLLRSMDVLIVPSRDETVMRETFSQALVQGMLTALPVLVNDLPILLEKIDQGGGVLFRNERELADAMAKVAGDADLRRRWGERARRTALDRYVWSTEAFVAKYLVT